MMRGRTLDLEALDGLALDLLEKFDAVDRHRSEARAFITASSHLLAFRRSLRGVIEKDLGIPARQVNRRSAWDRLAGLEDD